MRRASEQGNTQNALNAAVQNWNYNQTLPWQNLNEMIAQISGNYGGTTSQTQPFYENTGANIGSGALGGAAIGSMFGPIGTGVGAGAGALLSLFSDRRIKEDIQKIGALPNGLNVYSFRFIGSPELHIGVMADEVEQVMPESVSTRPSGIKMVDYSALA